MANWLPITDKVAAGGTAGLIATLVIGVLGLLHVTLPAALVSLIVFAVMFVVSYIKTETKLGPKLTAVADGVLRDMESEGPVR